MVIGRVVGVGDVADGGIRGSCGWWVMGMRMRVDDGDGDDGG